MIDALTGVLIIPAVAAGLLAILPGYRLTARLNVLATLLTFLTAVSLFVVEPRSGSYLLVDDLNKVFIVLTTFVGFTTSVFSASYIGHEIEIGRLTPTSVRFYHAMYQALMFAMNLALVANNIGLMWVAIEMATLTTVLMVGIYAHEALEAPGNIILGDWHCPGSVRDHPVLHGGTAGNWRGRKPWCGPARRTPQN
jgi:hydrogenase-4 component F